jgi:hypothetical protein
VPPRSWREPSVPKPPIKCLKGKVTESDLRKASALFSRQPSAAKIGAARLAHACLTVVLSHLESGDIISDDGAPEATLGHIMRDLVAYLEPHHKVALLHLAAVRLNSDGSRLSDRAIRAILHTPSTQHAHNWEQSEYPDLEDWSVATDTPDIHYLPVILHPQPLPLLRAISTFSSLSLLSLNLAYSTTKDLERLVTVIPAGLRELAMVGIRFSGPHGESLEQSANNRRGRVWLRGLALLGRKMIVLRVSA